MYHSKHFAAKNVVPPSVGAADSTHQLQIRLSPAVPASLFANLDDPGIICESSGSALSKVLHKKAAVLERGSCLLYLITSGGENKNLPDLAIEFRAGGVPGERWPDQPIILLLYYLLLKGLVWPLLVN